MTIILLALAAAVAPTDSQSLPSTSRMYRELRTFCSTRERSVQTRPGVAETLSPSSSTLLSRSERRSSQSSAHPRRLKALALGSGDSWWRQPFNKFSSQFNDFRGEGFRRQYNDFLQNKPVLANALTGAVLSVVGDLVCQEIVEKKSWEEVDKRRLAALTTWGFAYSGGVNVHVAKLYMKLLPEWIKKNAMKQGVACTLMDNFVYSPFFYLPAFYICMSMMQGVSFDGAKQKLTDKWAETNVALWSMWVPLQTLNYGFVPAHFRVPFVNACNVVWKVVLDELAHRNKPAEVEPKRRFRLWGRRKHDNEQPANANR